MKTNFTKTAVFALRLEPQLARFVESQAVDGNCSEYLRALVAQDAIEKLAMSELTTGSGKTVLRVLSLLKARMLIALKAGRGRLAGVPQRLKLRALEPLSELMSHVFKE